MLVQEMFDAALAVVGQHNSVVGQGNPGYVIDPTQFVNAVKAAGGTSADRLKNLSYEDILGYMATKGNAKPILLAKDIAKIFRGKEETTFVSAKKADKMSLRELVENYDPTEPESPVGKRLKEISREEKFIVFKGNVIDVNTTLSLLQEIKQGYKGRDTIIIDQEVYEVHPVGSQPESFVEENPLYRNRPLRPDGTCDQTNRSWNGVDLKVRQLIRVAMDIGALKDITIEKAHDIMDLVMEDKAFDRFAKRYHAAAVEFKKLESLGKLPVLKLMLKKEAGRPKRPFDNAKKVEFIKRSNATTGNAVWFCDTDSYTQFWKK